MQGRFHRAVEQLDPSIHDIRATSYALQAGATRVGTGLAATAGLPN